MSRPSQHIDKKLLKTGIQMLVEKGIDDLKVTTVCKRAKVNPGMFVYYFKNKENFIDKVLEYLKEDLFESESFDHIQTYSWRKKIEEFLYISSMFVVKYSKLSYQATHSILLNQKTPSPVLKEHFKRRFSHLKKLLEEGENLGKIKLSLPIEEATVMIITSIDAPLFYAYSQVSIFDESSKEHLKDPENIRKRIKAVLRAIEVVDDNLS